MDADRNLLFGVLALQADLIDAQQFIEACLLWTSRKDVPLADLLIQRGWIVPADRDHVDYLLERKLHKHGGDPRASLAAIPDDIKRSLAALEDDDIQRSLAGLPAPDGAAHQATVDYVTEPHERYARLRLHATGGIGRVWLAHDGNLSRDVALKELRPERAEQAALWTRFLQEAQITGQLEHPGVVPVYELARRRDDRQPFYTMRFVKGRTLSEAARTYHDKRLACQADALDLPALLNAFVTVCNTVAYAHSRGVIHRDLKGQNVILGDFGEVVVLDWGLAKRLADSRDDRRPDAAPAPESPDAADSGQTIQGQALGTPAYMAPEQAAGRLDLIDRRTDVYGLGAVLYEILTGQPPFAGPDMGTVLRKVQEEEPPPPRQFWPEVPPALEALCLRALAKRPADRPAAAADLAQAVQGWQEFERRKAEEALRHQSEILQSILNSMSDGVVVADETGKFLLWNPAAERIIGRPAEHVPPDQWSVHFGCFLPDRVTYYSAEQLPMVRAIRGEVFDDVELYVRHTKRPEGVMMSISGRPLRDQQGAVKGGVIVIRDITARKLVEEELRKSRERFELAVQGSQDGLWDWDLTNDEVYYSPRYKAILGYEEDEEFPNRSEEWAQRVHPEDIDRFLAELRAHFKSRESLCWVEFRFRHKDGSYRWIRSRAFVLRDAAGRVYRMAGSHEDITERKHAEETLRQGEERYRSVVAAMQDGIVLVDADGSIRSCNAAAERILGLSAEQLMGRTSHDPRWRAIHEDGSPFPGETHPPVVTLRTGRPCTDVVMGVHKPDGTLTWLTVNAQPLFQADGRTLAGVVASFEDITERKRTEALLRQTAERLACCEEQLRRLTAKKLLP
jgi:PAS domain S-box-containing protein